MFRCVGIGVYGVLVFWCFGLMVFWCFGVMVFWVLVWVSGEFRCLGV